LKIFLWSLKDERLWLLVWAGGIIGVVSFIIYLYPLIGEMMKGFLDKDAIIKALVGRDASLMMDRSYFDVWMCLEFFSYFGILVGAYPLIFASGALSAEMEHGTMEMLLAQPVSRTRVVLEKFAALMVNMLLLCAVGYLAVLAGALLWVDEQASFREYIYIFINNYFLLFSLAAFGFFCCVLINGQRTALGLIIGAAVVSFLVYRALSAAGKALWLTYLTPYRYADATKILATGRFNWDDVIILTLIGLAFLYASVAFFKYKDIAV
jgi:ABC-2 type transport system permease protein